MMSFAIKCLAVLLLAASCSFAQQGPPDGHIPMQNFGVDLSKLSNTPRYEVNGKTATKAAVFEAIGADSRFPRARAHLTVIGTRDEQAQARKAVESYGVPVPHDVAVHYYDVASPLVAKHNQDGKPTVYVQDGTGKVLHLQKDASDLRPALVAAGVLPPLPKPTPEPKVEPTPTPEPKVEPAPEAGSSVWGTIQILAMVLTVFVVGVIVGRQKEEDKL
jgi:hypothetical protein